jgi:uncharacterized spore protein YtfJ
MENKEFFSFTNQPEKLVSILDKMVDIAKPENAFNKPIEAQNHTVIGASEVIVSMGIGFGGGNKHPQGDDKPESKKGGGGGGGGISLCRPVASIVISSNGVTIKPIFDYTKIAIAAITTLCSMLIFMSRIAKGMR